jgi:Cys-Gly metallodipeptidase DUG1
MPDLTREGGSIPVTLTFADTLGVNVLLLPMGRGDDGAQYLSFNIFLLAVFDSILSSSTNEKLNKSNFIEGVSRFASIGSQSFRLLLDKVVGNLPL